MRQKIFFLLVVGLLGAFLPGKPAHSSQKVFIVAVINNQIITRQDLDNRLKFTFLGSPHSPSAADLKKAEGPVLTKMVEEALQVQHAAQFEVIPTQQEIDLQIGAIEKNNNLKPGDLARQMTAAGIPLETLYDLVRAQVAWGKFIQFLRPMARVGKTDIKTHLKQSKEREHPRYLLSEIVVKAQGTDPDALAQQVFGQLKAGKPFPVIAQEISVAPSAAVGGDVGWVDEDQLAAPLKEALQQMPVEAVSPPILVGSHLYLLAFRAKKDHETARQTLKMRQLEITFPLGLDASQKEAHRRKWTEQVQKAQNCADFSKLGDTIQGATLSFHEDVNPFQMTGGLDKVLRDLEVGKVSEALPHSEGKEKGVQFFTICERKTASDEEVSEAAHKEVEQHLEQKAFASLVNRRLKLMKQNAHIEVRI